MDGLLPRPLVLGLPLIYSIQLPSYLFLFTSSSPFSANPLSVLGPTLTVPDQICLSGAKASSFLLSRSPCPIMRAAQNQLEDDSDCDYEVWQYANTVVRMTRHRHHSNVIIAKSEI